MRTLHCITGVSALALALTHAGVAHAQNHGGVTIRGTGGRMSSSSHSSGGGGYRSGRYGRGGLGGGGGGNGGPVELELAMGYLSPYVADAGFHGQSVQPSSGNYIAVDTTGRGLGFVQPAMFEAQAALRWAIGPYFSLGGGLGFMAGGQYDHPFEDSESRAVVGNASTLYGFSATVTAQFMIPLGLVTVRPGLNAGLRFWDVDAAGLGRGRCSYTDLNHMFHDNVECSSSVGALVPYVQPRVALDFDTPGPFGIGAYMGVDVYPAWGFAAGITLSVRTPPFGGGWYQTFEPPAPPPAPAVVPAAPEGQPGVVEGVAAEAAPQPQYTPPPPAGVNTFGGPPAP